MKFQKVFEVREVSSGLPYPFWEEVIYELELKEQSLEYPNEENTSVIRCYKKHLPDLGLEEWFSLKSVGQQLTILFEKVEQPIVEHDVDLVECVKAKFVDELFFNARQQTRHAHLASKRHYDRLGGGYIFPDYCFSMPLSEREYLAIRAFNGNPVFRFEVNK